MKGYTESPGLERWSPAVWALLIEPRPWRKLKEGGIEIETHPAALEYCLREGVIGLGWNIGEFGKPFERFDEYLERLKSLHEETYSPERLGEVKPGDLVWFAAKTTKPIEGPDKTRVAEFAESRLYLALVVGPWEYRQTPLGWAVDIVAVAPALIKYAGRWDKEKFETDLELSQEDRGLIHQLREHFLKKPPAVSPVHSLGDAFASLSKRAWAQLVHGASPAFREVPPIPPVKTGDPML